MTVQRVTSTPPVGPSLAVDDGGTPWIAYYTSTSSASSVQVATPEGTDWRIDPVEFTGGCETCRTAVVVTGGGPAVGYSDGGAGVLVATNDGENGWVSFDVGPGGQGLAAARTADGLALTYYDGGQVVLATGGPSGPFETAVVADVDTGSAVDEGAGTAVAPTGDGFAIAWHDAVDGVGIATGATGSLETLETLGETAGGESPSVASSGDGSTVYVAWYDPRAQDLLVGAYGEIEGLAIAAPSPTSAGGGASPTTGPPAGDCTPAQGGVATVVAEGSRSRTAAASRSPPAKRSRSSSTTATTVRRRPAQHPDLPERGRAVRPAVPGRARVRPAGRRVPGGCPRGGELLLQLPGPPDDDRQRGGRRIGR